MGIEKIVLNEEQTKRFLSCFINSAFRVIDSKENQTEQANDAEQESKNTDS